MFLILYACNNSKTQTIAATRDTTITKVNAFIPVFMDSAEVSRFLKRNNITNTDSIRIEGFYKQRNYQYAWFDSAGMAEHAFSFINLFRSYRETMADSTLFVPKLDTLIDALDTAGGFNDQQFHLLAPDTELLLTRYFFKYAERAFEGSAQLDLRSLGWYIPRKKIDLDAFLDSVIAHPQQDIRSLWPVHPMFNRLKEQLKKYTIIDKQHKWPAIYFSKSAYRLGDTAIDIGLMKQRLTLLGDLHAGDTGHIFTAATEAAVKQFQLRYGLTHDGVAGKEMLEALNITPRQIIRKLMINIERARWVPIPGKGRYLVVNIPEFRLHAFEGGIRQFSMNVVVGKPATHTIIFNADMKYVVLSPYWNVPYSIVKNEMGRSASYFSRRNMEIVGRYSDGTPMVRQKPGANNALGRVKFLFPNRYSIYLHDTPSKSLFGASRRAFSHGCIRVEEPEKLAIYLLDKQPEWTPEKIRAGMMANKEISITLSQDVPVFIGYFTATVTTEGLLNLRPDIYGHDKKMEARLFPPES